jgi:hypothetical protein
MADRHETGKPAETPAFLFEDVSVVMAARSPVDEGLLEPSVQ